MKKTIKSNKGTTLVLVLVVLTIVILLGATFAQSSTQNYKSTKVDENIDTTYFAADSAVEKCFDKIYTLTINNASFASTYGITYDITTSQAIANEKFAEDVRDKLQNEIDTVWFSQTSPGAIKIDIADNTTNSAIIESLKLEVVPPVINNGSSATITIGLTAQVKYNGFLNITEHKKVFSKMAFDVILPATFELRGPIYTIGDLMVTSSAAIGASDIGLSVLGDVHVYGTSPEKTSQPQQFYYGGIYAKNRGILEINGNAYSRSLIRTGEYGANDNSRIDITKDAIAQGIMAFGDNDNIFVYRNAYTLDDVEMNGRNSVIAINGDYYGLNNEGYGHDDSSAIVNSSTVRYFTDDAKKSRIIVNGNVMINGGTMKVDQNGIGTDEIENASVAWYDETNGPLYKEWIFQGMPGGSYQSWSHGLYSVYPNKIRGFANLFQVWTPIANTEFNSTGSNPVRTNINSWLNTINSTVLGGDNNLSTTPAAIKGYCKNEVAADNRMYYMDTADEVLSKIKRAINLYDGFTADNLEGLDYTYPLDPIPGITSEHYTTTQSWIGFWNNTVTTSSPITWSGPGNTYCNGIASRLTFLNKVFTDMLNKPFVARSVVYSTTTSSAISHSSTQEFGKLQTKLTDFVNSHSLNPSIIHISTATSINVPDTTMNGYSGSSYYLLVNDDPRATLTLDNVTFNGIIFTPGKVILENGAKVTGAIIAAGKGFGPSSPYISPSADVIPGTTQSRAPRIVADGANLSCLDNGDYAAIQCIGPDNEINFPDINGKTGRDLIINQFNLQGLSLGYIFK